MTANVVKSIWITPYTCFSAVVVQAGFHGLGLLNFRCNVNFLISLDPVLFQHYRNYLKKQMLFPLSMFGVKELDRETQQHS